MSSASPPLDEVLPLYEAQQPIPLDTTGAGPRRDALPLGGDEVAFPEAQTAAP